MPSAAAASSSSSTAPWSVMPGRQHASSWPIAARASSCASPRSRASVAACRNASSASTEAPARCPARPSSRNRSGRSPAAQLERGPEPRGGLVEGERRGGGARGEHVVLDRALRGAERCRGGEVVGEIGERAARARAARLERLADAEVQLGAPRPREAVVERAPHELVAEPPRALAAGDLVDHAAGVGLVERAQQLGVGETGGAPDDVELDLGPRGRGELEQVDRGRREPGEPPAHDLADALGTAQLARRAMHVDPAVRQLDRARLDQRAPELAEQERVALGERVQRLRERDRRIAPRRAPDELRHLRVRQAGQPEPDDVVAAQVGEGLGERGRDVRLRVPERREQQDRGAAGPGQMAQQQQRRPVRPVQVLEHEQRRAAPRGAVEQTGHGGVEPVALGVRIGVRRGREPAGPRGEVGQEPRELPAGRAQRGGQLRTEGADELVERLDERPVRRVQHGIAGAVEHERPVRRRAGGELAYEPALAGAGLAAEQDDAAGLALRSRQQRAQPLQLGGAADERERRGHAECAGESVHRPSSRTADQD